MRVGQIWLARWIGLVLLINFHVNIFSVASKLSELELLTWNLCETEMLLLGLLTIDRLIVAMALNEISGWAMDQSTVVVALAEVISWVIVYLWHCITSILRYHTSYITGREEQTAPAYKRPTAGLRFSLWFEAATTSDIVGSRQIG